MKPKECRLIEPLLGAYALEALDFEERAAVESHLATCEYCSGALARFQSVAAMLMMTPEPATPAPRVRARLISVLDSGRRPRREPFLRGLWPRFGLAAGLAALILINLALFWQVRSVRDEQARMGADLQVDQTALALASYPTTQVVLLQGEAVGGTFLFEPERRFAVLHMWGLDPLESRQSYQAWLVRPDGSRVSAGLFSADPNSIFTSAVLSSPAPVGEFSTLGVTIEPAGGSEEPTGRRVLSADL
jgi:anti-sigma-K factor RskA